MARDLTSHVYGLYDHDNGLAKIGISQRPHLRMTPGEAQRRRIEFVFAYQTREHFARQAETVAHFTYLTRRVLHPDPSIIGRTEWFDISRTDLGFAGRTIQRFIQILEDAPTSWRVTEEAKSSATAINARFAHITGTDSRRMGALDG